MTLSSQFARVDGGMRTWRSDQILEIGRPQPLEDRSTFVDSASCRNTAGRIEVSFSKGAKYMHDADSLPPPKKRLALFFDGTWNSPENNTNVWRLYLMLASHGAEGLAQECYYDEGVGTYWYDRLSGGAFGAGLSENVRSGYRWLMEHYEYGDEIYLFGFSRGAFTARSLAGIIARCGLLKSDAPMSFWDVFERYRKGELVRPIYKLKYLQSQGETEFDFEEKVLLSRAWYHPKLIKMVGVWDTVGSLGVPLGNIKGISRRRLRFHNTNLSKVVEHSYQALALDEHRKPYWAMLWTNFVPDHPDPASAFQFDDRIVEQRWFSGAHCNVGGGYQHDLMPQRPLAWLQEKASAAGLGFRCLVQVTDEDYDFSPRDSYAEFLHGAYRLLTLGRPYVRWVQSEPVKKKGGIVETVNERIDRSVFRRCQLCPGYRPLSLLEWADRKKLSICGILDSLDNYQHLWAPCTTRGIDSPLGRATKSLGS